MAAHVLLGNPNGVESDGSLHPTHADDPSCFFSYSELYPADVPPYPDISHSAPDGRGGHFNFLDQPCPDPPWRLPGSLQDEGRMLHSAAVFS